MRSSVIPVLVALVGCDTGDEFMADLTVCTTSSTEASISPSVPSSLGFSAEEAIAALDLDVDVSALAVDGTPAPTRGFTFSFTPASEVWVEEREYTGDEPYAGCLVGTNLVVPGTLAIDTSDGWFSGVGEATLTAQAASADSIWIDAAFEVTPSESLLDEAVAANHDGCADGDVTVWFGQVAREFAPWSTGPSGDIENETCDGGAVLYRWGSEP